MKFLFTIWLVFAQGSPVSGIDKPVVIDSLLAIGADTIETYEIRVGAIKKAVTMDETGRSHAAHARLLMRFPSPERMVAAERAAKRAIRKEKHNADLIGLLSKLYWRIGRRGTSLEYAERAIEANAINPIGHFWVGRYHFWETMKYLWMNRVEVNQDTDGRVRSHNIDLGRWGEEARKKAESAFLHLLNLNPAHDEARRYLGLIYYQTQRAIELRDLYMSVTKYQPENPTGYFTVGMSYHLERDYERAYQAYSNGLKRMPENEQRFMLAVFTDEQTDTLATVPDMQTLQRFWTGKNPFFLSPVNERMLEQCRRVAYVNLRFGEPEKEIAGWTTDRGQAYIRYGDPLALQSRPAKVDTHLDDPIIMQKLRFHEAASFGTSSDQYEFGKELWDYENFILVFDNTDARGAWKFRIASLNGAIVGLEDLVERVPTRFVDPFGDRRFEMPYQVAQFRGAKGNSRVELYYAVPASKIEATTSKGLGTVQLDKGLFLFDSNWDTLDVQKTQVKRLGWVRDIGRSGYLLSGEILNIAPGKYNIAAEVLDQKTKSVGGLRFAIPVRTFSRTALEISSILLARRVVAKPERPFGRDRFVVLPNPMKATPRNKKAYFYFEVYNLKRDTFGRTKYQVTYQTKLIPTG
ncbi:MAG: GWxTD domain-containing protein, partial [Candidatus Latescibacterota bacterium]|nr:GWxTD domain-containing protein [Candidatus Latescibacterota bacterium]